MGIRIHKVIYKLNVSVYVSPTTIYTILTGYIIPATAEKIRRKKAMKSLNRTAVAVGSTVGSVSSAFADTSESVDAITDLLPVIVELAVVIALLGFVINMLKKMN